MNRRGIIAGLLGAPIAAKAAAGASPSPFMTAVPYDDWTGGACVQAPGIPAPQVMRLARAAGLFTDEMLRNAARVDIGSPQALDPDLFAAKSFSLSAKIVMQRERDIERRVANAFLDDDRGLWGLYHRMREVASP